MPDTREYSKRRFKMMMGIFTFVVCVVCIIIITISVIDGRMADPGVEAPLIKEYATIPKGMTKG